MPVNQGSSVENLDPVGIRTLGEKCGETDSIWEISGSITTAASTEGEVSASV